MPLHMIVMEADPDVVEEWKWMGTPVWSHDGIICTGESSKNVVNLTFAKGASLNDPARLFNSSLDGNLRRAIDIREGEDLDESALHPLEKFIVACGEAWNSHGVEAILAMHAEDSMGFLRAQGLRRVDP